jgi:hypothetical protein
MSVFSSAINRVFGKAIERRVHQALATETDATFLVGGHGWSFEERDRLDYDREEVLRQALEAWRVNPLARRIVELTTQYVVGGGLRLRADAPATHDFLTAWWTHPLNQLAMRVYEWCDELTRSGELFLLLSTDAAGMSYVRAVPAAQIEQIQTAANDVQQELAYTQRGQNPGEEITWAAYDPHNDERGEDGRFAPVLLHYAINRPVGAVHGESDLAPLLRWLSRYAAWLEDRARLNRYRNSFLFVVKGRWASEAERSARQAALSAAPPSPGSILVVDDSESWEVINPQLASQEAGEDGLALKKMIAAGAGLPLHFLAEPEDSNRSTAESAGGPTYRHFEQRQEFFTWLVGDVAHAAVRRRAQVDARVNPDAVIQVNGADLSARDNASLAVATSTITAALTDLRDRGVIDDAELLRMVYRFAGEVVDVEDLLARGRKAGPVMKETVSGTAKPGVTPVKGKPAGVKVNDAGDLNGLPKVE